MRLPATDRAWPTLPLALLALAALVAVVGVLAAPAPSQTDRMADTVQDFGAAVQELRGEDACADLTPAAQRAVAARTGRLDCATTIRSFSYGIDAGPLRDAEIARAQVAGTRATVTGQDLLARGRPYGRPLTLERLGGRWRIASFGPP